MLLLLSFLSLFYIRAGKRADPRTATQHSRAAVTQWLQIKADKANSLTLTHPDMLLISSQPETDQRCSSVEEGTTPTSVRLFLWGLWEEKNTFLMKTIDCFSVCGCFVWQWESNVTLHLIYLTPQSCRCRTHCCFGILKPPYSHRATHYYTHLVFFQSVKPRTAISRIILKRDRKDWKTHTIVKSATFYHMFV